MATPSTVPHAWTVDDLGAFYTQHRAELMAHPSRVLKDQIKAEEITQDALITFKLAAPNSNQKSTHSTYLHRTISGGEDTLKPSIRTLPLPIP